MQLPDEWTIILSTLLGPIFAVLITLWAQKRGDWQRGRQDIYSVMMRMRRNALSVEFVSALNIVPVYFHRDKKVLDRYSILITLFDNPAWSSKDQKAIKRLNEQVDEAIAYLLSEMSKSLSIPIDQIQILRGAYAPQGWADEEHLTRHLRLGLLSLVNGNVNLRVKLVDNESINGESQSGSGAVGK